MRVASSLAVVFAFASACSFPDVEIGPVPIDAQAVADATDRDAPLEDTVDALVDAIAEAAPEAEVGEDGLVCRSGELCDCDGDGDRKPGPGCSGTPEGDCDDDDERRSRLVTSFAAHDGSKTRHGGDWNCDGTVEREFGAGGVRCGGLALGPCAGAAGYRESMPACGAKATYVACKVTGALCGDDPTQTREIVVRCR
jgi:hypothetical protein